MSKNIVNIRFFRPPAPNGMGRMLLVFWEKLDGVPKGDRTYVEAENPRKNRDCSLTELKLGLNAPDTETTSLRHRVSGRFQREPGRAPGGLQCENGSPTGLTAVEEC